MRFGFFHWAAGLIVALMLAVPGTAQPPGPGPDGPPPPPHGTPPPDAGPRPDDPSPRDGDGRRGGRMPDRDEVRDIATAMGINPDELEQEDIRELFEIVRMAKLARELSLDKESAIAMMRVFDENRKKYWELREARREATSELKAKIAAGASDEELTAAVEALLDMERQGAELKVTSYREAAAVVGLNPLQQAKLYVFIEEFDDDFRRMVWSARRDHRDGQGRGDRDDDDDSKDEEKP